MNAVTFVDLLRDAGYRTALIGKSHLQNFTPHAPIIKRPPPRDGFHEPSTGAGAGAAQRSRRADATSRRRRNTGTQGRRACAHPVLRLRSCDAGARAWRRGGRRLRPLARRARPQGEKSARAEEQPAARLHRARRPIAPRSRRSSTRRHSSASAPAPISTRRIADAPFFLMVSFPDPHHPFNPPGKYWDMYKPEQFPGAGGLPAQRLDAAGAGAEHHGASAKAARPTSSGMNTIGVSAREAQEARALTCGMIACIDDAIGGVLARARPQRPARRHRGDLHQRPRRSSRRPPADAQGRRAVPEHRAGAVHLVRPAGDGHGRSAPTRSPRPWIFPRPCSSAPRIEPSSGMQAQQPVAGARTAARCATSVFIQYDHQASSPGTERAGAGAHADRRPLPAERVPRHRLGRAVRSRERSRRIRQSMGRSGPCRNARAHDRAAACWPRSSTSIACRCRRGGRDRYFVLPRSSAENPDALTSPPQRATCSLMLAMSCGPVSPETSKPCASSFFRTSGSACARASRPRSGARAMSGGVPSFTSSPNHTRGEFGIAELGKGRHVRHRRPALGAGDAEHLEFAGGVRAAPRCSPGRIRTASGRRPDRSPAGRSRDRARG